MYIETPKPAINPIDASPRLNRRLEFMYGKSHFLVKRYLDQYISNVEISGEEYLQKGPALLLSNHSNPLDPLILTTYPKAKIHFLITETSMVLGWKSKLLSLAGQITKRKLDMDTQSIRAMKKWIEVGAIVGTFPEGHFTWDGKPAPIQPGLGQLIKFLDVPVITARIINGDKIKPAWATNFRKTSIAIEIDPPIKFHHTDDIEGIISQRISLSPSQRVSWPAHGQNLASGLSRVLRHCFNCGADNSLNEYRNELSCSSCGNTWHVDAENTLSDNSSREMTISDVVQLVKSTVINNFIHNKNWKSLHKVQVFDMTKPQWKELERGILSLTQDQLMVGDWSVQTSEILAHTIDWNEFVLIRTRHARYGIRLPLDSRLHIETVLEYIHETNSSHS